MVVSGSRASRRESGRLGPLDRLGPIDDFNSPIAQAARTRLSAEDALLDGANVVFGLRSGREETVFHLARVNVAQDDFKHGSLHLGLVVVVVIVVEFFRFARQPDRPVVDSSVSAVSQPVALFVSCVGQQDFEHNFGGNRIGMSPDSTARVEQDIADESLAEHDAKSVSDSRSA